MRWTATRLLTLVLAALALPACSSSPDAVDNRALTTAPVDAPARSAGPALWKVADADTTIYLFGTVHLLPKDVRWFRGRIETALRSSDVLVTEVIQDEAALAEAGRVVEERGTLPSGENLRDRLDDRDRAAYEAAMSTADLPVDAFDRYEPWLAASLLSTGLLVSRGNDPAAGAEEVLAREAGPGMRREQLETVGFQLGLFDALSNEQQLRLLVQTARLADRIEPTFDAMLAAWTNGDATALAGMINLSMAQSGLMEDLLHSRNRTWAGWVADRLASPGTVFVAVGAGHLAGDLSVQRVLARRGIRSVRVR